MLYISVGYRVKSKQGTWFRQWSTQRWKDHQVKGYTLNEKRLQQVLQNMQQLEEAVKLIQLPGNTNELTATEAKGLLDIIANYTQSFILLNQFDGNSLPDTKLHESVTYEIEHKEAVKAIAELKKQLIKREKHQHCSATKETRLLKAYYIPLYKLLVVTTCIKVLKNRQRTSSTLL
jgi:Virulence protein RhuM family